MSLLLTHISPRGIVMVGEDHVTGTGGPYDRFPKFQIFRTNRGHQIFLGASGHLGPIHRVFRVTQKMLREMGLELPQFQEFLSGGIAHMLSKRPAHEIDPQRDVIYPPVQTVVCGWDPFAKKIRGFLSLHTGQGEGVSHELALPDLAVIGFVPASDVTALGKFNVFMNQNYAQNDSVWVAKQLAEKLNEIANKFPEEVNPACHFAASDAAGDLIPLPSNMPQPWNVEEIADKRGVR